MRQPEVIGFQISPEKLAQLDLMAKAMNCDRSQVLSEAVDTYLRLANPDKRGTEPLNGGDVGSLVWRSDAEDDRTGGVSPAMEVDPDSPIYPAQTGTYSFLDPPTAPRKMAEAQVQLPTLDAGKTKGRLLVFLSTKGGSGVTTVACTFALTLARESGKRVLLIDLTLSRGDVALNLGIQALHTTLDAFQNFSRMDRSYLSSLPERHSSGLFVLAAPGDFAGVDVSREAICKLLEVAGEEFDYVVVDAGSTLDRKHIYDFGKSSIIYVVTQIGIAELRNSNRLISKFPREGGPEIEIVINRYDPRSQEIDDDHVTKALTRPARWRIPNDYAAVRRMQITATPLSGSSPVSRTILQMIKRVLGSRGTLQPSKEINLFGWKLSRR